MPRIDHFTTHFMNVKQAYDSKGKSPLFYADGSDVPKSESDDLYKYLTSDYKSGCYTWLDALFREKNGNWFIETDHRVWNGKLEGKTYDLECPIRKDIYVNLNFNKQGFPTAECGNQNYSQGNNIKFWHPRDKRVAGFDADSIWADLLCSGDLQYSDSSLGVFVCAEGAAPKK